MAKAQEIYSETVSFLPEEERLQLATLILGGLQTVKPVGKSPTSPLSRAQKYVRSLDLQGRDPVRELLDERRAEAQSSS